MGYENREYMRDGSYTERIAGLGVDFTPVVKALILVNVAVFLLQIFITRPAPLAMPIDELDEAMEKHKAIYDKSRTGAKKDEVAEKVEWEKQKEAMREAQERAMEQLSGLLNGPRVSVIEQWCQLDPKKTVYEGQVWRLLTCAFCHHRLAIWHILVNMVLLYWFGTRLENMYGSREFLVFYMAAAICGSLAYVALALYTGSTNSAIGASGAVMGVMMLYTIYYPFETVTLFWVLPIPIWALLSLYALFDLHPVLLALAGYGLYTGIAHAGHLGGLAFGYLYYKSGVRLEAPFDRVPRPAVRKRRVVREVPPREVPTSDGLNEQVDEILKKISEQGKESLTDQERAFLKEASARYRGLR